MTTPARETLARLWDWAGHSHVAAEDVDAMRDVVAAALDEADRLRERAERLRPEVWRFALAMEERMRAHDPKRGDSWREERWPWLLDRMREEFGELKNAIASQAPAEDIVREAADIANFAMMVADNEARATLEPAGANGPSK